MSDKQRIYQIDLFRFIAALSVLLFHYLFRGYAADGMSTIPFNELGEVFRYGYLGVDVFFIISGFVISMSIKERSLYDFISSRISRLYPAYWFCVLLTFFVMLWFGGDRYPVTYDLMVQNLSMLQGFFDIPDIDGAYWSLLVELKFYAIIILFLLVFKLVPLRIEFMIYGWFLLTVIYPFTDHITAMKLANYYLILGWSSYFIAGMLLYEIYQKRFLILNSIILLGCLVLSIYYATQRAEFQTEHYHTHFSPWVIGFVITISYLTMYLMAIGKLNRINSPSLLKLGILTYPLYLVHQNIGFIIFNNLGAYLNKYLLFGLTLLLMIVLAYLINKFIEVPVSGFIRSNSKKIKLFFQRNS